jgi:hypothetical protein
MNRAFITRWNQRYLDDDPSAAAKEERLLTQVGSAVRQRGWYSKPELIQVGEWKARGRIRGRLAQNSDADVKAITMSAFTAPEDRQHRILGTLHGVGDPMASALLMVWDPKRHTVWTSAHLRHSKDSSAADFSRRKSLSARAYILRTRPICSAAAPSRIAWASTCVTSIGPCGNGTR